MTWLTLLAIVAVVLVVIAFKLKKGAGVDGSAYVKNPILFSPAERSFLGVLDQAIGKEYRVLGKVRVADAVGVKSTTDRAAWQRAFNRINAKHFDFLLCDKGDLSVVCAIELDDQSHQARARQERDAFLAELCEAIELPLVRIQVGRSYSVQELRATLTAALAPKHQIALGGEASSSTAHGRIEPVLEPSVEPAHQTLNVAIEQATASAPSCPKCGNPMVRRRARAGRNEGEEFWGCSAFPQCRGVVPIDV